MCDCGLVWEGGTDGPYNVEMGLKPVMNTSCAPANTCVSNSFYLTETLVNVFCAYMLYCACVVCSVNIFFNAYHHQLSCYSPTKMAAAANLNFLIIHSLKKTFVCGPFILPYRLCFIHQSESKVTDKMEIKRTIVLSLKPLSIRI